MRLRANLFFEPRDCWIGVFWKRYASLVENFHSVFPREERLDCYVCIVPCLPLRLTFYWNGEEPKT